MKWFMHLHFGLWIGANSSMGLSNSETAIQRCSCKKMFWKYAANLQEITHAEVWFQ